MTKKPLSPKHGKHLPHNKHIEELAANDYVDPAEHDTFSDSDILAPQGVTVKTSENESNEPGAEKTWARSEDEEKQWRLKDLESHSLEWLYERAQEIGIPDWAKLPKNELVHRLADASPSH